MSVKSEDEQPDLSVKDLGVEEKPFRGQVKHDKTRYGAITNRAEKAKIQMKLLLPWQQLDFGGFRPKKKV